MCFNLYLVRLIQLGQQGFDMGRPRVKVEFLVRLRAKMSGTEKKRKEQNTAECIAMGEGGIRSVEKEKIM